MRILLIGAGHTHMLILKKLTQVATPGIQWVLVNPWNDFFYSGGFTSVLAGEKRLQDITIALMPLLKKTHVKGNSVEFWQDQAIGLEPSTSKVLLRKNGWQNFNRLSLNVGFSETPKDLIAIRPLQNFLKTLQNPTIKQLQIVGAGALGIETALCLSWSQQFSIQVVESSNEILKEAPRPIQEKARELLDERNVRISLKADYKDYVADLRLNAFSKQHPNWLKHSDLSFHGEALQTHLSLQTSHPGIFAVGEGAQNSDHPWLQNGVTALQQAPILWHNLRSESQNELVKFAPQKTTLALLNCGDETALGYKGSWSFGKTRLNWLWKKWLDQRFLDQFRK